MILVDTSSWIHFLRPDGHPKVRSRVERALRSGEACWCPLVQLELWNGVQGKRERKVLRDFARVLPELPFDREVWTRAYELATGARERGVTVPATDVLIAACALQHGAGLESADSDFDHLTAVGGPTRLVRTRSRPSLGE
ncbi:MAG: PIN domain-containing protein [Gemmatimonadota bacterium]|nr:PIN domain-containing protein [Gemmatimonadota bacterium]